MSKTMIIRKISIKGVLTDPTSIKLSDPTGAYGVKRNDNNAYVVADGTAMTKVSTGVYTYNFTDPAYSLTYTYWVEIVYDGETYHLDFTATGGVDNGTIAYDIETMVDILGLYFNELLQIAGDAPDEFTVYERVNMLNRAQKIACSLILPDALSTLETSDLNKSLTNGTYAISSLTSVPLLKPMGLIGVKITGGKFCERIKFQEYKELTNQSKTWTTTKPAYYIYAETITVLPTATENADFFFIKEPTDMDYDAGIDCALSDEIQEVILDYAAFIGFLYMKNDERAGKAFNSALLLINSINHRVDPDYTVLTYASREAYLDWNLKSGLNREADNTRKIS